MPSGRKARAEDWLGGHTSTYGVRNESEWAFALRRNVQFGSVRIARDLDFRFVISRYYSTIYDAWA